ncbi:solute carrier family 35 member B1-like [Anneissia japonica]|uniref:solute carrier family 35 member B1-like n=1 Tax=Anneissia japonica TaxID=1529436 RepID=UPI0014254F99|nr:solute carrier family 35 member B1-like [Anneissia japonica]
MKALQITVTQDGDRREPELGSRKGHGYTSIDISEKHGRSNSRSQTDDDSMQGSSTKLIVCFFGIFICYFYYGIVQEKVTRSTYGEGDRFTDFFCLVFFQCIVNAMFSKAAIAITKPEPDPTTWKLYAVCSTTYLGAMVASNSALKYVSYPLQVLGKSCKPIPVMILGVLIAQKRYPLRKYFFVLFIVFGVALFMYKGDSPSKGNADHAFGFGEILLMVSLTLDGLTGASQDKMRGEYKTSPYHMMFNINKWSVLFLFIICIVTGELFHFMEFVAKYPNTIVNILLFGLASALGQSFIFTTVSSFGPLTCSIITTTRKFFTILGSVILFNNPLIYRQWIGVVFVFVGLGLDSMYGKTKKN